MVATENGSFEMTILSFNAKEVERVVQHALAAPTFDSAAAPHKSVQSYDNFVQALRRGGCQAYLIRGDVELAASFRRWQRAAV